VSVLLENKGNALVKIPMRHVRVTIVGVEKRKNQAALV